jgi:hypothetical protein
MGVKGSGLEGEGQSVSSVETAKIGSVFPLTPEERLPTFVKSHREYESKILPVILEMLMHTLNPLATRLVLCLRFQKIERFRIASVN